VSGRARAGVCARSDPDRDRRRRKRTRGNKSFYGSTTPDGNRRRGQYFKTYRPERTALKELASSYCSTPSNKSYRAYRLCYYLVLPSLLRVLWYPPDRELLLEVEREFYNILCAYRYRSITMNNSPCLEDSEPFRLSVWLRQISRPLLRSSAKL
jgi:hypothetical protein